jgi:hypothetical protein
MAYFWSQEMVSILWLNDNSLESHLYYPLVVSGPGAINLHLEDVPPGYDYFFLFINSTIGQMYTLSNTFSILAADTTPSVTPPSPSGSLQLSLWAGLRFRPTLRYYLRHSSKWGCRFVHEYPNLCLASIASRLYFWCILDNRLVIHMLNDHLLSFGLLAN